MHQLNEENINEVVHIVTEMVGGTWQLIALIIGVTLAFQVIEKIIRIITSRFIDVE